jgi:hypothetical protein
MGERHGGALRSACNLDVGLELIGKRLYDAGTKAWLNLACTTDVLVRPSDAVVADTKLPIGSNDIVSNGDLTLTFVVRECVLQGIDNQFGHNEAEAYGLIGRYRTSFSKHFESESAAIADHRGRETLAQFQ